MQIDIPLHMYKLGLQIFAHGICRLKCQFLYSALKIILHLFVIPFRERVLILYSARNQPSILQLLCLFFWESSSTLQRTLSGRSFTLKAYVRVLLQNLSHNFIKFRGPPGVLSHGSCTPDHFTVSPDARKRHCDLYVEVGVFFIVLGFQYAISNISISSLLC